MSGEVKSIRVHEYGKVQIDTAAGTEATPGDEELLVKMISAPVKPFDLLMIHGKRRIYSQLPFTSGVEGLGQVLKVGKSVDDKLVGRKVLVGSTKGTFTTQGIFPRNQVYVLDSDVDLDLVAQNYLVNPLTAAGLIAAVKREEAETVVYTAAASHVGKWFSVFAAKNEVKTIAVVRNEKDFEEVKGHNADVVLSSSDPSFDEQLKDAVEKLKATAVVDCLSGELAPAILAKLPPDSTLWNYGNLAADELKGVSFRTVSSGKRIRRFDVFADFIAPEDHAYMEGLLNKIYKGSKIVKQDMQEFGFERIQEVLDSWEGKQKKPVLKF